MACFISSDDPGANSKIDIDDDLIKNNPAFLARIQKSLQDAIDKINSGETKLDADQIASINSLNNIRICKNPRPGALDYRGPGTFKDTFYLPVSYVLSDADTLAGVIIHDSRHSEQQARGLDYGSSTHIPMEREASQFAVGVINKIGEFPSSVLNTYEQDAITGHLPRGGEDKSTAESTQKVFNKMKEPQKKRN